MGQTNISYAAKIPVALVPQSQIRFRVRGLIKEGEYLACKEPGAVFLVISGIKYSAERKT